jgi:hypothetical protein
VVERPLGRRGHGERRLMRRLIDEPVTDDEHLSSLRRSLKDCVELRAFCINVGYAHQHYDPQIAHYSAAIEKCRRGDYPFGNAPQSILWQD